jgi:hypothetical protein
MSEMKVEVEQFMIPVWHTELVRDKDITLKSVKGEAAAAEVFHQMLDNSPVEKLAIIYCTHDQKMVGAEIVAVGSADMVHTNMADLLRGLIKSGLSACYIAHNHVSSSSQASLPDYTFTLAAEKACNALGIIMFDHLVIAVGEHYSVYQHEGELSQKLAMDTIQKTIRKLAGAYGGTAGLLGFPLPPPSGKIPPSDYVINEVLGDFLPKLPPKK